MEGVQQIAAEIAFHPAQPATETSEVSAGEDPSLLQPRSSALEALRTVAEAYRDARGRPPRATELARCLALTPLGPAQDGRLSGGPLHLAGIRIEPLDPEPPES